MLLDALEDSLDDEEDLWDDDEAFGPFGQSEEAQAQELIYKALEVKSVKQKKQLATKALELDPKCLDAFLLLAEIETDALKSLTILDVALKAGELKLGKDYFKENKGYFWGLLETRPYMRVRQALATLLMELLRPEEAIVHFEEMLELNPNDSQGIRYDLLKAYFVTDQYDKINKLFKQFNQEEDAFTAYGKVLLEYFTKGISKNLKSLLNHALDVNPHVLPYLNKKKKLPKAPPEYIGFGDESEAISYVLEFGKIWWFEEELMDWLG
nr:hypothetical protein [Bacillus pinisoli]